MKIIKSVEIVKFRSVYKADIETSDITVFSGKNNSGKSNVLKALNLFFNGEVSYDSPYDHERDFNIAYTGRAGGRREIEIRVDFYGTGEGKLKDDFSITRRFANGLMGQPEYFSSNLATQKYIERNDGNVTREFTRFYNKLNYIYVPAVRDKLFTKRLFTLFERVIDGAAGKTFNSSLASLNGVLEDKSLGISSDFHSMLNLDTRASLSTRPTDILEAIGIEVETGITIQRGKSRTRQYVDLFSTGDGILMSYVPHFLAYISQHHSTKKFIWGFEEPENSLEYAKAQVLADKFANEFSRSAQIFLTTHSPAFIDLDKHDFVKLYRVYKRPDDPKSTSQIQTLANIQQRLRLEGIGSSERDVMAHEIGMTELAREIERRVNEVRLEEDELRRNLEEISRPIVYSEGKNYTYLSKAKKMYDSTADYEIIDAGSSSRMKNLYDQSISVPPRHKVVFIWDVDCVSYKSLVKSDKVLPYVLDLYPGNTRITRGIEASMPERNIIKASNSSRFYQEEHLPTGGVKTNMRKDVVSKYFCDENPSDKNFKMLRKAISAIGRHING